MPPISFVADDLTGAGDVLAQAHRYGLDAVLLLDHTAPMPAADVVGLAGPSRSLGGAAFDELVRAQLGRIATADSELVLYKVCSTFDSSARRGSIGRGIELVHEHFPRHGPVPVVPAQPEFGRYTAFSTHFAAHTGVVHRLDRHPVMSVHPSTPMHEADLRRVLAEQFGERPALDAVHLPSYVDGTFDGRWSACRGGAAPAFVVDAATDAQLDTIALALGDEPERPAVVVGSGGIMAAVARERTGQQPRQPASQRASGPVLAVSASASSINAAQLADAVGRGWSEIAVPADLLHGSDDAVSAALHDRAATELAAGRNVVVHTTRGADDPRYAGGPVDSAHLGALLGNLARAMAEGGLTRDIAVCGGDTSSHALRAMGVQQLRVSDQFVTTAPICRSDEQAPVAGCRLLLKGGQAGPTEILRRFAGADAEQELPA